jgi:hypothetical protein
MLPDLDRILAEKMLKFSVTPDAMLSMQNKDSHEPHAALSTVYVERLLSSLREIAEEKRLFRS